MDQLEVEEVDGHRREREDRDRERQRKEEAPAHVVLHRPGDLGVGHVVVHAGVLIDLVGLDLVVLALGRRVRELVLHPVVLGPAADRRQLGVVAELIGASP